MKWTANQTLKAAHPDTIRQRFDRLAAAVDVLGEGVEYWSEDR